LLRLLSHRCVRMQRTGFSTRRRDSLSFRAHGVHCQGTTDADTALVNSTYEWMDGVGRDRYGCRTATVWILQYQSRSSWHGNASRAIQHVLRADATGHGQRESTGISAGGKSLAGGFTLWRASV
jgi:hypothetical protein